MRKIKTFLLLSFLVTALTIVLAACGSKNKLPKTNYEKVKFAFNGVEKTFNGSSLNSKTNLNKEILLAAKNPSSALSIIDSVYVDGDSQGDVIDDLEYDEPPMIQFQCLKHVLEKTGKKYSFNEKYYEDITGTMYFDITDGTKKNESNEYKYDYNFRLALSISINSNDFITANVSFDISLRQGNKTISTQWYVYMELDYDMKNTTPNYKLSMYTANSEEDLTYRLGYTYEYDYVNVKDSKINEWRKFVLESNQKLVLDSTHSTLDAYISDPNFTYQADTAKWYKNNNLRKITQMNDSKKLVLGNAFFTGIGLNSTDIDGTSFTSKNGIKSSIISDLYSEMTRLFKEDVIYSIISESEDHSQGGGGDSQDTLTGIKVYNESKSSTFENRTLEYDPTLNEALSSCTYWPNNEKPVIYATWSNNREEIITNLQSLNYSIKIGNENAQTINLSDKVSAVLSRFGDVSKTATAFNLIISYPNTNVKTEIPIRIGDTIKDILQSAGVDIELVEAGFPAITNNMKVTKSGNQFVISNFTDDDAFFGYIGALESNGFLSVNFDMYGKVDNGNLLFARAYNDENRKIELEVKDNLSTEWNYTLVNSYIGSIINLQAPKGQNILFEYVTDGDSKRVIIYGMSETEVSTYLSGIINANIIYVSGKHLLRIVDNVNDKYYELGIGSLFEGSFEIGLTYKTLDIMRIEFSVNGSTTKQTFNVTYDYDDYYVRYYSADITLNSGDVVTFYGTNIDLDAVEFLWGTSDFTASGTSINVVNVPTNYTYMICFDDTSYDAEENILMVGFYNTGSGDTPPKPDPNKD